MASVLAGTAPLERAQTSGGISESMDFYKRKYGEKIRIAGFGGRKPQFIEDIMDFYFEKIENPLNSLASEFSEYFQFMQNARKEDKKEKSGGILKTIHSFAPHFFDFRVWKKLTGQARKPEIAALHQIRDILIDVHKLDKDFYGRDPQDVFLSVMDQFKRFKNKLLTPDEQNSNFLKSTFLTVKRFFKETYQEAKDDDLRFYKKKFNEDGMKFEKPGASIQENVQAIKDILYSKNCVHIAFAPKAEEKVGDISEKLKEGNELTKKIDSREEFQQNTEKRNGTKHGMPGWLSKLFKFGGIALMLGAIFGKKGLIAGAILPLVTWIIPKMIFKGMSLMFNGVTSFFKMFLTSPLAAIKFIAKLAASVGTAGGGAALFAGITAHDILKEGGAKDQWKAGNKGGAISTALLGSKSQSLGERIEKQALKWGGLGATIGTFVAGPVGAAAGFAIGATAGGIAKLIKNEIETGTLKNKLLKYKKDSIDPYFKEISKGSSEIFNKLRDFLRNPSISGIKDTAKTISNTLKETYQNLTGIYYKKVNEEMETYFRNTFTYDFKTGRLTLSDSVKDNNLMKKIQEQSQIIPTLNLQDIEVLKSYLEKTKGLKPSAAGGNIQNLITPTNLPSILKDSGVQDLLNLSLGNNEARNQIIKRLEAQEREILESKSIGDRLQNYLDSIGIKGGKNVIDFLSGKAGVPGGLKSLGVEGVSDLVEMIKGIDKTKFDTSKILSQIEDWKKLYVNKLKSEAKNLALMAWENILSGVQELTKVLSDKKFEADIHIPEKENTSNMEKQKR